MSGGIGEANFTRGIALCEQIKNAVEISQQADRRVPGNVGLCPAYFTGNRVAEHIGEEYREKFQVAYLGDVDGDHSMDVEALAPALLAFGKLIRAANAELNRDRATMRVLVDSNLSTSAS